MKDYILTDFADKRIFNYLYSTEKGFVGYMDKLTKKERALIGAKLIWKRKENKYTADEFAIEFAEWAIDYSFNGAYSNDVKELLEEFKKEKGL
jgi:hypothetical protein